jgi:Flp pilus assembly pilin Flp
MLKLLGRMYRDEQGAEGLEKLLIIAAIALPLLGILIYFRNDITKWINEGWDAVRGRGVTDPDSRTLN